MLFGSLSGGFLHPSLLSTIFVDPHLRHGSQVRCSVESCCGERFFIASTHYSFTRQHDAVIRQAGLGVPSRPSNQVWSRIAPPGPLRRTSHSICRRNRVQLTITPRQQPMLCVFDPAAMNTIVLKDHQQHMPLFEEMQWFMKYVRC